MSDIRHIYKIFAEQSQMQLWTLQTELPRFVFAEIQPILRETLSNQSKVMLGHERHHRVHETLDAFGTIAKFVSGSNGTEAEDRGLDTAYNDYGALHPPLYPPTIPEYYDYGAQVLIEVQQGSGR